MAPHLTPLPGQAKLASSHSQEPPRSWFLRRLDSLLSEPLRRAPAWDLVRYRLLVGAACFLFLFNVLYVPGALLVGLPALPAVAAALLYLGTLVLARRASSAGPPAMLLVASLSLVLIMAVFTSKHSIVSMHAVTMLLPALAVYLGGARQGLFITLLMFLLLAIGYPLYLSWSGTPINVDFSPAQFQFAHLCAGIAFLGAWGLGALHNAARDAAQSSLEEMHRTMVDVSRQAGMAEVAIGVLHNVGNTLNSVNVSVNLVSDQLRLSRLSGLAKATHLLREHAADLDSFLTRDPQGSKLPGYLIALSEQLQEERNAVLQEMHALSESVEHIKSIIRMQQKHARAAGAVEQVAVPRLIDEALRLHAVSFERLGILIEQDYSPVPSIAVDRHKLLQILVNLLSNARHALVESPRPDKRLTIRVRRVPEREQLLIEVTDNGVGIAPEYLPRLFTQGFTTKKTGHGFGLHISALAATELSGSLRCTSTGLGQGATFTLELPFAGDDTHELDGPQARALSQSSTS